MPPREYSIVVPAFNEAARIGGALAAITTCIREQGWDAEVLVVDDGSTDATVAAVDEWIARYPEIRLIRNASN